MKKELINKNKDYNPWKIVESEESYNNILKKYLEKSELILARKSLLYSIYGYIPCEYRACEYVPYDLFFGRPDIIIRGNFKESLNYKILKNMLLHGNPYPYEVSSKIIMGLDLDSGMKI